MTKEEHIERHKLLHKGFDELIADYISCTHSLILNKPVGELMKWSYEQTINPTEEERD